MDFLKTLFNVENKTILITGGTGVLGGEMAKGFLKAGAKVVIIGTNELKLKKKADDLNQYGATVEGYRCNVLDEEEIRLVNEKILNKYKQIDVLINAAGGHVPGALIGPHQNIFDLKIDEFKKVIDLNLHGTVLPTLIFGKSMSSNKNGSIINVSSMASTRAITRAVGYSAAKAGIDNFTRWLAMEMALKFGDGIRVNAIAPGFLLTDQNKNLLTNTDGSISKRGRTILNMTPFKRFGNPDELIGTVIWLASDASKFITGAIVPVDGGFSIYSGV